MELLASVTDTPWHVIGKSKPKTQEAPTSRFVPAKGSKPLKCTLDDDISAEIPKKKRKITSNVATSKKRKQNDELEVKSRKKQKTKSILSDSDQTVVVPSGSQWDSNNYSCAYDAFFIVLYHIWLSNPNAWTENFAQINEQYMGLLANQFNQVVQNNITLEVARDLLRNVLHTQHPELFPMGTRGTSVGHLASQMLQSNTKIAQSQFTCTQCNQSTKLKTDRKFKYKYDANSLALSSTMEWITGLEKQTSKKCTTCTNTMTKQVMYTNAPKLIVLEYPDFDITTSHKIALDSDNMEQKELLLKGIVYYSENHFTSRIIDTNSNVWFHDGMATGTQCINEGPLSTISGENLNKYNDKTLVLAVYAEV
jgi:hypothetical protein